MCPRAPHKNDHVLKMMKKNLVELRPVLLLPKANFSLRQTCRNISVASAACAGDHSVITVADHSAADHSVITVADHYFCSRPFCNRHLRQVTKMYSMYIIISINCLLTDMMVMSISHMG